MKKQWKHHTVEDNVAVLKGHLLEQAPVSALCDKRRLQSPVLYR